jgi:hypothetical protein
VLIFKITAKSFELVFNHGMHDERIVDALWMEEGEGMVSSVDSSGTLMVYTPRMMLRATQRM